MKNQFARLIIASVVGGAITASVAIAGTPDDSARRLAVGPVESLNPKAGTAVVLGQSVLLHSLSQVKVGDTVALFGKSLPDGRLAVSAIQQRGNYVAGSTPVYLSGVVERMNSSLGRVLISGVTVDLTPLMFSGSVALAVGSKVEVEGTQPTAGGAILASGVSGGGLTSKLATNSVGSVTSSGVSGGGLNASGVSGGGLHASGVSGGG